jgi:hypothetical protein
MSDQNDNAQPSSSQGGQKNAGGVNDIDIDVDDLDEGNESIEPDDGVDGRVEDEETRHAGGGRQSESEKPDSPDSRWGSQREE